MGRNLEIVFSARSSWGRESQRDGFPLGAPAVTVRSELCEGVRPPRTTTAVPSDGRSSRKVRPKLFPSTLGHDVPRMIARLARNGASRLSTSGTGERGP